MDNASAVIDLEVQQDLKRVSANMNIVQNVAYIVKPGEILVSSNVAYESHVHQDAGINQDEYDYI